MSYPYTVITFSASGIHEYHFMNLRNAISAYSSYVTEMNNGINYRSFSHIQLENEENEVIAEEFKYVDESEIMDRTADLIWDAINKSLDEFREQYSIEDDGIPADTQIDLENGIDQICNTICKAIVFLEDVK